MLPGDDQVTGEWQEQLRTAAGWKEKAVGL